MEKELSPNDSIKSVETNTQAIVARKVMILAIVLGIIAFIYQQNLDDFLALVGNHYLPFKVQEQQSLNLRLIHYGTFFWLLSLVAIVFSLSIRYARTLKIPNIKPKILGRIFLLILIPTWVHYSTREWVFYGHPCWDGYCDYSEYIANVLLQPDERNIQELLRFMHSYSHANSPVAPFLIAVVHWLAEISIVDSYRLCCFIATTVSMALLITLFRAFEIKRNVRLSLMILFAFHMTVIRCSLFPQSDAFALVWVSALLMLAVARIEKPKTWQLWVAAAINMTGLFVKLSFLPALALFPIVEVMVAWKDKKLFSSLFLHLIRTGFLCSLLPLLFYLFFQYIAGTLQEYSVEFTNAGSEDNAYPFVLEAVLKTVAFSIIPIAIGWRGFTLKHGIMGVWVVLYCLSLWFTHAAGWNRYYLCTIPALVMLSAPGLERMNAISRCPLAWQYALTVAALNIVALQLHLYSY